MGPGVIPNTEHSASERSSEGMGRGHMGRQRGSLKTIHTTGAALDCVLDDLDADVARLEETVAEEHARSAKLRATVLAGGAPCSSHGEVSSTPHVASRARLLGSIAQRKAPNEEVLRFLRGRGVDPGALNVPRTMHCLAPTDAGAAIAVGLIGALAPSVSVTPRAADSLASVLQRAQDAGLKDAVESVLGSSASSVIDRLPGQLHRFRDHSHDLGRLIVEPFLERTSGRVDPRRLISHLFVDACGATGVPLPGSTYIRQWLRLFDVSDPRMARLHSRFAAYRHTDVVGTALTSAGLRLYTWLGEIPADSLRRPKLGIIAHGTTAYAIGALALVDPFFAARRSLVNWSSTALLVKNTIELTRREQTLRAETAKVRQETMRILDDMCAPGAA